MRIFVYGGTVGDAIQKTAWEENVSLIIMGAEGKGMLEGILLGKRIHRGAAPG